MLLRLKKNSILLITGFFLLGFLSCGTGGQKSEGEEETETSISDISEQEETYTEIEEIKLPADFPEDIPVYADAEVEMVHEVVPDSTIIFEFAIKAKLGEVADFLKQELVKNGWEISGEGGSEEMEYINFTAKKEKRNLGFRLRPDERSSTDFTETWEITFLRMDYYPKGFF
jgi:hypothetical protein